MTITVIVVGSNPSETSPDESPFHIATRSRLILDQWFTWTPVIYIPLNVVDSKTEKNRPLTAAQFYEALPLLKSKLEKAGDYKVVALGQTADRALTMLGVKHFAAPHPSGLNRKLNDRDYVEQMKKNLRAFIEEPEVPVDN